MANLIFDFDGTLSDSLDVAVKIYNRIAPKYKLKEVQPEEVAEFQNQTWADVIKALKIPRRLIPVLAIHIMQQSKMRIAEFKPFEGIKEMLEYLSCSGHRLFIISSNSVENIQIFLQNNQLEHFEKVYSSPKFFGKHHTIKKVIRENRLQKKDTFYIGDEVRDVVASRKSGISVYSVCWGYNTQGALKKVNPEHLIVEPNQLPVRIEEYFCQLA